MNKDWGSCKYCNLEFASKEHSAKHWRMCSRRTDKAVGTVLRKMSPANVRRLELLQAKRAKLNKTPADTIASAQTRGDADVTAENQSAAKSFGYTACCADGPTTEWSVSLNVPRSDTELQDAILRLDRAFSHISVTDATGLAVSLATQEAIVRIQKALRILTDA